MGINEKLNIKEKALAAHTRLDQHAKVIESVTGDITKHNRVIPELGKEAITTKGKVADLTAKLEDAESKIEKLNAIVAALSTFKGLFKILIGRGGR